MMNQTMELNRYPRCTASAAVRRRQRRRRYELFNTILEALVTLGIGASFILCSIIFLCII